MLTAWDTNLFALTDHCNATAYCLSTTLASTVSDHTFSVSNIYAPSDHRQTPAFLSQLAEIANLFTSAPHGSTLSLVTLVSPGSAAAVPAARAA